MNKSDALKKLDSAIAAARSAAQAGAESQRKGEDRLRAFVIEAGPILEEYRRELESRGVKTEVKVGEASLGFKILFVNGGHVGFELWSKKGWPEYVGTSAEGGAKHISEGGDDGDVCTRQALEGRIHRAIESYAARAHANGGLPIQTH